MSVSEVSSVALVGGAQTLSLSQFFTVSTVGANPAYLVVNALDRNEYTAAANLNTGSFGGNGATLTLAAVGGDARGAGIVYSWQAATHQYVSSVYGALSDLTYTSSDSLYDVTSLSLFGTNSLTVAQQNAGNAYALMQADANGYLGSVTVATDPGYSGAAAPQATPNSIATIAARFVDQPWNNNGCWVLASTIAAEAGAGLPVQSTAIGVPGKANGAWVVVYNGPLSANTTWQNLVRAGDIVTFGTSHGGGHITTCVSGSGSSAMLVDNITYTNARGQISNLANDGSPNDVLVAAPHLASQEFRGVAANAVVIYALDTPLVTPKIVSAALDTGKAAALTAWFGVTDPGGKAITKYQAYNSDSRDSLMAGKVLQSAGSADNAVTVASLATLSLQAGSSATTDMVTLRAFNGTYWGDWQSVTVNVSVPAPLPPVLATKTAAQTWLQGQKINLVLPAGAFTDPQHQALSYSASVAGGAALPSWLAFDAATRAFTGTVPAGLVQFSIVVTATDAGGLSNSETFAVNVPAAAPTILARTATQSWVAGSTVSFTLPDGTFSDPQGQVLSYTATLSNGAALPVWLHFNIATHSFSGTAPTSLQTLLLKVTATDTSKLSASETFGASIVKGVGDFVLGDWAGAASVGAGGSTGSFPDVLRPAWAADNGPGEHFAFLMGAAHHTHV